VHGPQQIAMWIDGRTLKMYVNAIEHGNLWVAVDGDDEIAGFVEIDGHEVSKLFVRGASAGTGSAADWFSRRSKRSERTVAHQSISRPRWLMTASSYHATTWYSLGGSQQVSVPL
jgi:hypothetical protein